jgi:hypothetical protein
MLNRLSQTISSLKVLLPVYNNNDALEYSLGIILRSTLSDMLMTLKLQDIYVSSVRDNKSDEEIQNILLECSREILSDGLYHTVEYGKKINDAGQLTKEEVSAGYNNFVKKFFEFYPDYKFDGSKPQLDRPKNFQFSPTNVFNTLMGKEELKGLGRIYDTWLYYSKYEHFNVIYFDLMLDSHENKKQRVSRCIDDFFIHTHCLLTILTEAKEGNDIYKGITIHILRKAEELFNERKLKVNNDTRSSQ